MNYIDTGRGLEKQFSSKMIEMSRLLDTVDRASLQQVGQLSLKATGEIGRLHAMGSDIMFNSDLYKNIVRNLENLR